MRRIARPCCCTLVALATLFGMAAAPRATGKARARKEVKNGALVLWGVANKDKKSDPRPFLTCRLHRTPCTHVRYLVLCQPPAWD